MKRKKNGPPRNRGAKTKTPEGNSYSQRELAKICGCDRASVRNWLELEGIEADARGRFGDEAIEAISKHQQDGDDGHADKDPETGLNWFQAKLREEAISKRRKNEDEERARSDRWVSTAKHHEIVSAITSRLEQLAGKARSVLALDGRQAAELQRLVDELRNEAANQIALTPS